MERFMTPNGMVWALQMVIPFRFGSRAFRSGDWIVGDGFMRIALSASAFAEKRAELELTSRRIA